MDAFRVGYKKTWHLLKELKGSFIVGWCGHYFDHRFRKLSLDDLDINDPRICKNCRIKYLAAQNQE